jgi:hypothetical protein
MALVLNLAVGDACLVAASTAARDEEVREVPPGQPPADSAAVAPSATPTATPPLGISPPHDFRQRGQGDEAAILGGAPIVQHTDTDVGAETGAPGEGRKAPIYKRWWFWTAVGGVVATAVLIAAGGKDETTPDLPDFPNPPAR